MSVPDRIDEPRCGLYAIRSDGRDIPAAIMDDGAGNLFAMVDGRKMPVDTVWVSHRRDITKDEYNRLLSRPQPLAAITHDNALTSVPSLLTTANKWRDVTITNQETAAKAKDLGCRISDAHKIIDKMRKDEKAPHIAAGREVDARFGPTLDKLNAAIIVMRAKLTEWMTAEKRRKDAESEALRKATVESASGEDKTLDPVPDSQAVQVRGNQPGRAASLKTHRYAVMVDYDKAAMAVGIRNHPDVVEAMTKLASRIARSNPAKIEIPGFEVKEEERASL